MTDIERREQQAVVDPRSGEVLDLATIGEADLLDLFLAAQDYERKVRQWRTAAEDELIRRADELAGFQIGGYNVDVDRKSYREWDVDDVEAVVAQLVHANELTLADVAGLIKTQRHIDGNIAKRLIDRGSPTVVNALRSCFTWKQRGRATVRITAPTEQ